MTQTKEYRETHREQHRVASAQYYATHGEQCRARGRRLMDKYRKLWTEFMRGRVCAHCGTEECLEWHHVDPATKSFAIAAKVRANPVLAAAECDKCIVLCTKCHRALHKEKRCGV